MDRPKDKWIHQMNDGQIDEWVDREREGLGGMDRLLDEQAARWENERIPIHIRRHHCQEKYLSRFQIPAIRCVSLNNTTATFEHPHIITLKDPWVLEAYYIITLALSKHSSACFSPLHGPP